MVYGVIYCVGNCWIVSGEGWAVYFIVGFTAVDSMIGPLSSSVGFTVGFEISIGGGL